MIEARETKLMKEIRLHITQVGLLLDELAYETKAAPLAIRALELVANAFDVPRSVMCSRNRTERVVTARQAAQYVLRYGLDMTTQEIAYATGIVDHSTVLYSCEKIASMRKANSAFDERIRKLIDAVMTGKHRAA